MEYVKGTKVLDDQWEIIGEIGKGTSSTVYKICKSEDGVCEYSALKVIQIPLSGHDIPQSSAHMDEQSIRSYYRSVLDDIIKEISIMSALKEHPYIVSCEDYKILTHDDEKGWDVLIRMELLTSLKRYAKEHKLSEQDVIQLGKQISSALAYNQNKHIIHRDVKPENIFVDSKGIFKLGDFGVARIMGNVVDKMNMTKTGTPKYMAPEVYRGEPYDMSVDVYSLGLILYEYMNEGRMPFLPLPPASFGFPEESNALLQRMNGDAMPSPVGASSAFAKVILKACAFDSKNRYRTAGELNTALEQMNEWSTPEPKAEATSNSDVETGSEPKGESKPRLEPKQGLKSKTEAEADSKQKPESEVKENLTSSQFGGKQKKRSVAGLILLMIVVVLAVAVGLLMVLKLGRGMNVNVTGGFVIGQDLSNYSSIKLVDLGEAKEALSFQNLNVEMKLTQAGSGDPLPSNVRPISGRTNVRVVRCGKNLFAGSLKNTYSAYGGASVTVQENVTVPEWEASDAVRFAGKGGTSTIKLCFSFGEKGLQGQAYAFSIYMKNNGDCDAYISANGLTGGNSVKVAPGDQKRVEIVGIGRERYNLQFNLSAQVGVAYDVTLWHPQIEVGGTVTDYEPYRGNSYSLTFDEKVCAGKVDLRNGTLEQEWVLKELDGTEKWQTIDNIIDGTGRTFLVMDEPAPGVPTNVLGNVICNAFPTMIYNEFNENAVTAIGVYSGGQIAMRVPFVDTEEWRRFLAAQKAAGMPLQIAYQLEKPLISNVEIESIAPLNGENVLYTDADSLSVSYASNEA